MEKVVCYYRTSTRTNETGDSKERQKQICLKYCNNTNYQIVSETYEVITGTLPVTERTKFLEMIDFCEENEITKIVFSDWTRFARSILAQEYSLHYLKSKGIECISATTGSMNDNESDVLMRTLFGAISQFEKDSLVKKLRVARERKRESQGKCEGRKSISETQPELVQIVKRLRRKNPKTKRVRSYETISKLVSEMGYKSSTGNRYSSSVIMNICQN